MSPPPPPLFHTVTQKPSLQSALDVRHVEQKLRCWCCKVVRLGFVGICLKFASGAKTVAGFPENGFPEKCTGEKESMDEPAAEEDVDDARVGLPTLILLLLLLLEEAVLVLMLSSSALLAGSSEDLVGNKSIMSMSLARVSQL